MVAVVVVIVVVVVIAVVVGVGVIVVGGACAVVVEAVLFVWSVGVFAPLLFALWCVRPSVVCC